MLLFMHYRGPALLMTLVDSRRLLRSMYSSRSRVSVPKHFAQRSDPTGKIDADGVRAVQKSYPDVDTMWMP